MSETNIHIHAGSILEVEADAIVNPANSFLDHKGGLARVIAEAATPVNHPLVSSDTASVAGLYAWILDHERAPLIPVGGCHVTSPGALPFKGVIHAVGPVWGGGEYMERDLLQFTHENILEACEREGYTSVVIPAISCGVFGFPVDQAAPIAVEVGCWGIDYGVRDVTFALTDDEHVAAYTAALASLRP